MGRTFGMITVPPDELVFSQAKVRPSSTARKHDMTRSDRVWYLAQISQIAVIDDKAPPRDAVSLNFANLSTSRPEQAIYATRRGRRMADLPYA